MTREQLAAAIYEADMEAFHTAEAAKAPTLPVPDTATMAALAAHLTDGAAHMDLQREVIAAHVAAHKGDWRGFVLGAIAHHKCALRRIPKESIDAAMEAAGMTPDGGALAASKS
jgi:membrane protein DedA with SNARE-associated domain